MYEFDRLFDNEEMIHQVRPKERCAFLKTVVIGKCVSRPSYYSAVTKKKRSIITGGE